MYTVLFVIRFLLFFKFKNCWITVYYLNLFTEGKMHLSIVRDAILKKQKTTKKTQLITCEIMKIIIRRTLDKSIKYTRINYHFIFKCQSSVHYCSHTIGFQANDLLSSFCYYTNKTKTLCLQLTLSLNSESS